MNLRARWGAGVVKKSDIFADVLNGSPLRAFSRLDLLAPEGIRRGDISLMKKDYVLHSYVSGTSPLYLDYSLIFLELVSLNNLVVS